MVEIDRAGTRAGVQRAELMPETAGTLLRWTVTLPASGKVVRAITDSAGTEQLPWRRTPGRPLGEEPGLSVQSMPGFLVVRPAVVVPDAGRRCPRAEVTGG